MSGGGYQKWTWRFLRFQARTIPFRIRYHVSDQLVKTDILVALSEIFPRHHSACDAHRGDLAFGIAKSDVDIYAVVAYGAGESQSFEYPDIRTHDFTMDVLAPLKPADLYSAKGLVVVITGGGTGTFLKLESYPSMPRGR